MYIPSQKRAKTPRKERIQFFMILALILPSPLYFLLVLFVLSGQPNPNMYEDLDPWCDKYHPELSYGDCLDKAGIQSN